MGRLCRILPQFPEPQKILGSALWQQQAMLGGGGGRQQGTPLLCFAPAKATVGKAEGLKLQLRERPLRPGSHQLLQDRHQHLSSSSYWNSSCHLLPLLPDRAGTKDQSRLQGKSGCPQGSGKGRKGRSPSRRDEGLQSKLGSKESAVVSRTTGLPSRTRNIPKSPLLQQYWVIRKGKSIKYTRAKTLCRYKREQNTHAAKRTTCSPGDVQHLAQQKYPKFLK